MIRRELHVSVDFNFAAKLEIVDCLRCLFFDVHLLETGETKRMERQRLVGITFPLRYDARLEYCPKYVVLSTCVINLQGSHNGVNINWAVSGITIEGQAAREVGQE
jgi:hypothetical protein